MSAIEAVQSVAEWVPFVAKDADDDDARTSILYTQVDVLIKKSSDTSFSTKTLTGPPTDFREIGNGVYEVSLSAANLDTLGTFIYIVNGNGSLPTPAMKQYVGLVDVKAAAGVSPTSITIATNTLTGNVIDLNGKAVANETIYARVLEAPSILGTTPNIGGVTHDIVSAKTDNSGFFAITLAQGAVVDIVISAINYRRTLTVPANSTDKLFELP